MKRDVEEDVAGSEGEDAEGGGGGVEATVDAEGPPTSLENEVDATFPFSILQQKSNGAVGLVCGGEVEQQTTDRARLRELVDTNGADFPEPPQNFFLLNSHSFPGAFPITSIAETILSVKL